jgi:hypothetical protein
MMDTIIKESGWIGELGSPDGIVKYRVVDSNLNHLFYVEKARKKDPTYFRRISKGYPTKREAIDEMDDIIDAERIVEAINRKAKIYVPKSKRPKLCGCKK